MKSVLILYPHQLFPVSELPKVDAVMLVEEPLLFGVDNEFPARFHKQKIIFERASMRRYAEEVLWPAGLKVDYVELDVFLQTADLLEKVKKYDRTIMFDPVNEVLTLRLLQARREMGDEAPAIEFVTTPNFYLKEHEIRQYFADRHKHPFSEFYQWQRERFNILITDEYKPVGDDWMITAKSAKPGDQAPGMRVFGDNPWVADATKYVSEHFPDNPGSDACVWPTSHAEAAEWLKDFVNNRLDGYASHLELIDSQTPWLYHSALAASLNVGLLSPQQVVEAALKRHAENPVPFESLECFIRQILGWREFTRGIALVGGNNLRKANPLKANRKPTNAWYNGTTGLPPFDDMVKKVLAKGYANQAERLYIAGTLMTICEINPDDIHAWFNELFVDAHDWALTPNIYALSQFADNTSLEGGPFICTSKTLLDKSDYKRGEWCNVWDGLYWRFVEKHKVVLKKNSRMRAVVHRLDSLDPDQKRIISYRAEDFLAKFTQ
jgi:deoxyribodipyrimidine photolyase-related protein